MSGFSVGPTKGEVNGILGILFLAGIGLATLIVGIPALIRWLVEHLRWVS